MGVPDSENSNTGEKFADRDRDVEACRTPVKPSYRLLNLFGFLPRTKPESSSSTTLPTLHDGEPEGSISNVMWCFPLILFMTGLISLGVKVLFLYTVIDFYVNS